MFKFTSVLAAAGFAMLPLASQAATPTLGDVLKASGISANGYVDFGSTWNNRGSDNIPGVGQLTNGNGRNVSFRLNQVGLAVTTATSEGFSGTLDLLAGQDATQYGPNNAAGGDIVLKQAYAQYSNGGFTVLGGRFVTLAGFEVVNSSQNQNATRSLLFQVQPLSHTGVRASYAFNKVVTVTSGFSNSAGGATNDNNTQKTLEAQVAVTPFDGFNNALTFYRGIETPKLAAPGTPNDKRAPFLLDLVSSLQVTKSISLGLNYDFIRLQDVAGTAGHGVATYASFQICNDLRLGGRAELLEASNSATPGLDSRVTAFEYTFTTDYAATKNFNVLTDVRFDKANGANGVTPRPFAAANLAPPSTADAATSITVKGIYRF
jgi:hypothetical protein